MHILFVADGRSAITQNWIKVLQPLGHRLSLVSTYPCAPVDGAELVGVLPVAFARFGGSQAGAEKPVSTNKSLTNRFRPILAGARHLLGPWTLGFYRRQYIKIIDRVNPDLVHAMRIPYEGMLASFTPPQIPLLISTWGNDFTLHAPASRHMGRLTRRTLARADALLTDTPRDVRLAQQWGFDALKPSLVVVGNGGLDMEALDRVARRVKRAQPVQIINPRGLRSYVRNDTFFKAIPLVLEQHPEVQFVCPSMAGQKEALDWVERLGIGANVQLLPMLPQESLWEEFARSTVSVSISEHDGTPNSLLEAMALGCLPVCGDIESIRDWIEPGVNGDLVPAGDAEAAANAINRVLGDPSYCRGFGAANRKLILSKADRTSLLSSLGDFYSQWAGE